METCCSDRRPNCYCNNLIDLFPPIVRREMGEEIQQKQPREQYQRQFDVLLFYFHRKNTFPIANAIRFPNDKATMNGKCIGSVNNLSMSVVLFFLM